MLRKKLVPASRESVVRRDRNSAVGPKRKVNREELDEDEEEQLEDEEDEEEDEEEEEIAPVVKKKLTKRMPDARDRRRAEAEEEEGEDEEEEEESPAVSRIVKKKKLLTKRRVEPEEDEEEEEEEEKPRLKKRTTGAKVLAKGKPSKRLALVNAFNKAPMAGKGIKGGQHEAMITKIEDFVAGDGRVFLRFSYVLAEEVEGKNTVVGVTMIADSDGEPAWSVELVEEMLAKLGYELQRPVSAEDWDQVFEDIANNRPGCIVDINYSEKTGRQQVNFVDACENETIEAYRDSIPY